MSRETQATVTTRTDKYNGVIRRAEEAGKISAARADELRRLVDAMPQLVQITKAYICDACGAEPVAGADSGREGFGATADDLREIVAMFEQAAALAADRGEDGATLSELAGKYGLDDMPDIYELNVESSQRLETVSFPVDAVTRDLFSGKELQRHYDVNTRPKSGRINGKRIKPGTEVSVSVDVEDMEYIKQLSPALRNLTAEEERALMIGDALKRAGINAVSYNQMYHYMGHKSNIKGKDRDELDRIFSKLNTEILIDTAKESKAGIGRRRTYKGPILSTERITSDEFVTTKTADGKEEYVYVNGQPTKDLIHFLSPSRVMQFAIDKKQVSAVSLDVFQTPGKKNTTLEDYLLRWILHALNGQTPKNISMQKIYTDLGVNGGTATDRKKRSRLRMKMQRLLDYYISKGLQAENKKRGTVTRLTGYTMGQNLSLKTEKY